MEGFGDGKVDEQIGQRPVILVPLAIAQARNLSSSGSEQTFSFRGEAFTILPLRVNNSRNDSN